MNADPAAPRGLPHALRQVADQVPEPDLAETTWARGRRVRRRRRGATGAALTATLIAGIWVSMPRLPQDVSPATQDQTLVTAPDTLVDGTGAPDPAVWATLTAACLQDRGWQASSTGHVLSIPDQGIAQAEVDTAMEECGRDLGVAMPQQGWSAVVTETSDGRALAADVYAVYLDVATCLRSESLPVTPAPELADFVDAFIQGHAGWHPYLAAAADDVLPQALQACPMPRPDTTPVQTQPHAALVRSGA